MVNAKREARVRLVPLVLAASMLNALAACSAGNGACGTTPCADARADGRTDGGRDGAAGDVGDPSQREIVSLTITPMNPTLVVTGTTPATQVFHVMGTQRDGAQVAVAATFSIPDNHLGMISGDGTFTANGVAGGPVQVTAQTPGAGGTPVTVSTTLTVQLQRVVMGAGVTPDMVAMFGTAPTASDPASEANVLYPLDNVFMPANVAAPDIQWERGDAGDVYRLRIQKPDSTITAYVLHSGGAFTFDWQADPDSWRAILESDPNDPATLTVDRLQVAASRVVPGSTLHLQFAHGSIFGVVYYWDLSEGRMQRIDAVTATSTNFIPSPPRNGTDPSNRCVACHAISQNGRYLSAELWGGGDPSTVFDLTADLSVDPAPTVFPPGVSYLFSSFNPDATRLVINAGNAFGMIDPTTGSSVAATGLPTAQASHPAWSPDGNNIAFITNTNGGWAVDYTNGDLALLPRTSGDAFGAPVVVHTGSALSGAPEGGTTDSHPSWSPDSRFLAFGHATHSRSDGGGGMDIPGAIYVTHATAGATPVRLDRAVGPGTPLSYWPTFSPFVTTEPSGEHLFWLAFISRRDYGNATAVGTRGSTRRQIWVTAVSADATGDPSHVPYWLPGQNPAVQNMAGQWAPLPCRTNGASCSVSGECCSTSCDPGTHTCQPMTTCRTAGQTCGGNSDCCTGLTCIGNVCATPPG